MKSAKPRRTAAVEIAYIRKHLHRLKNMSGHQGDESLNKISMALDRLEVLTQVFSIQVLEKK